MGEEGNASGGDRNDLFRRNVDIIDEFAANHRVVFIVTGDDFVAEDLTDEFVVGAARVEIGEFDDTAELDVGLSDIEASFAIGGKVLGLRLGDEGAAGLRIVEDAVLRKTGIGADVVIDLSGAGSAIAQSFGFIRKDGRFCAIGLPHGNISVPWADMVLKAVNVYFSYSSGFETWEKCLFLINSGKVDLKPFTTAVYELSDWQKAFEDARTGKVLKAIIKI